MPTINDNSPAVVKPDSFPNHINQPSIELSIAYDFGTSSTKAAFRITKRGIFRANQHSLEHIGEIETVDFRGQPFVRTQIAWENSEDTNGTQPQQLWGHEVTLALKAGRISNDDVFSRLKPIVFQENHPDLIKVQTKISRLDDSIRQRPRRNAHPGEPQFVEIDQLQLLSDNMGHVHRYVLSQIAAPPNRHNNQVSILLPVAATPAQQQTMLDLAKTAGISDLSTIGEPTAALVRHVRIGRDDYTGRVLALLDIGAGSVDLQIWKIVSTQPLRIQEVIKSRTEWCGGDAVNKEAARIIIKGIASRSNMAKVLGSVQGTCRGKNMSESQFQDMLETEFEEAKKSFYHPSRARHKDTVVLTPEDMAEIYRSPLRKIMAMLRGAVEDMKQEGYREPFDTIVMFGGGANEYIQHQIESASEANKTLGVDCEIMSIRPTDASFMTAAAVGAIYIQEDEAILDKRVTLRGYYIARNIIAGDLPDVGEDDNLEFFKHDQQLRRTNVSKCLIQPGTTVGRRHLAIIRGERALLPEDQDVHRCWDHEERLYFSDQEVKDDTWVERPGNTLHEMPSPLKFKITAGWQ
ncbi:uncharacterized protein A1O9_07202 [Exophiala aquamarina CBS 119918]|uniref:Uncharacterized protein n=1 Tax=Exophiala aquamarina CBS 119918 TaxID=1182545 RepID=A0A072PB58_9EURO|nr:uncharacterized protein A1O9_07202 [Exophiala aquamarina CBS 119918]KEF57012.1 hypothetical protein A1O9_07202 [Exophiala aquamarina CBS 119918]